MYPNVSKRIYTYPNVSKRIYMYPNVSKRIYMYPNVSKRIYMYLCTHVCTDWTDGRMYAHDCTPVHVIVYDYI